MESKPSPSTQLFQVFLRLRPPQASPAITPAPSSFYPSLPPERFLTVEPPSPNSAAQPFASDAIEQRPTQITIHPLQDSRRRAVEKFGFTAVFEEPTSQLDVFNGVGVEGLVTGVLRDGRDALLATLGVTGSGKVSKQPSRRRPAAWSPAEPFADERRRATQY